MRLILAVVAVLSALTITNATHVSCEAGLSDTNDCQKKYCLCNGMVLTCQAGTTCAKTCVCAKWNFAVWVSPQNQSWLSTTTLILYSEMTSLLVKSGGAKFGDEEKMWRCVESSMGLPYFIGYVIAWRTIDIMFESSHRTKQELAPKLM